MYKYTTLDESGRICSTTDREEWAVPGAVIFDFPDNFDFSKQGDYILCNNELVYDPVGPNLAEQIAELKQNLANTDYVVQKMTEAQLGAIIIPEDDLNRYEQIMRQRQEWRDEINRLEVNNQ